ncbi:non-hydrolyzing UDP-N-acetylglucosamine 2-epimerase [Aquirufa antheringensis]|jgi:UDP-N-acetylglucosamine 2-epimerase (non-hydrolysing)|uniref:UDP-N-acetylglucosamine 2-epimerase (Non-hydrolyzing) n=1 Tax=Aquirufa antheringensis TaxID=2516559 RepID=A0A4Q9BEK1_9BACT|nr:UDP-N-acetylglucosamine 2-epimerase (non-hydrolyzing) [Aquirufa antheringensis]MCZ2484348.1 UDP-N-acetylglucosamine 2-epimerase (non-hydrolyzing) [Aquirufa antheringensis]TBH74444.1 UDP-N-acetylglucosamine 2-epimerase (non-hydrolyzing) [Aquirufa antheringensis]
MKVIQVVGARPNFMKVAPLHRAIQKLAGWTSKIVHTGQHFDAKMSDVFFTQLELPTPDFFLGIGGGSHTEVTAKIMVAFEKIVEAEQPDLIIVVGDVTSTLACTLVAIKMGIKVAHVEAGLRSFDRTMPEELNRILTDSVADYLFVTEESGLQHLKNEGVADERVFFSGNVMIDSLVRYQEKAKTTTILEDLGLATSDSRLSTADSGLATSDSRLSTADYIVMTMHRPANVDTKEGLESILELIELSSKDTKIIFPIHPRTRAHMEKFGLAERLDQAQNLIMTEPLGYLEFIQLMSNATAILTDSGGIQEETTYLGVPCLTFRDSTERPITVTLGTNQLLSDLDPKKTYAALQEILAGKVKKGSIPPLWDGKAAERIAAQLAEIFA